MQWLKNVGWTIKATVAWVNEWSCSEYADDDLENIMKGAKEKFHTERKLVSNFKMQKHAP